MAIVVAAGALGWRVAGRRRIVWRAAAGVLGPLYIGLPLGALMAVRWIGGREALLLLILIVVASDSAQYYAGRAFGRCLLSPALSPKRP